MFGERRNRIIIIMKLQQVNYKEKLLVNSSQSGEGTGFSQQLVRWLRVILRLDRYRVEESTKFGSKNLVGIRNKFSLGAT